jgi:hypothetical protein
VSLEPEREMVRRILPYAAPALVLALAVGSLLGGWSTGISAGIGIAVVATNFAANALSMAWAARTSPMLVAAVGLGGFVMRLGIILVLLIILDGRPWFSTPAFIAAVVPATLLLLVVEAKLLSGRMQVDLWSRAPEARR